MQIRTFFKKTDKLLKRVFGNIYNHYSLCYHKIALIIQLINGAIFIFYANNLITSEKNNIYEFTCIENKFSTSAQNKLYLFVKITAILHGARIVFQSNRENHKLSSYFHVTWCLRIEIFSHCNTLDIIYIILTLNHWMGKNQFHMEISKILINIRKYNIYSYV